MKRWLAAAGGLAVAILIVVACAERAPQAPSQVAQGNGSDENGEVRVQETPSPPIFPTAGPTPQSFPTAGPTPSSFPTAGPTPSSFPTAGPTPQSFPTAGPTPQSFPSTNGPQPTPLPTPTPTPTPSPTPTPGNSPTPGPSPSTSPTPNPNSFVVTVVSVASNRPYVASRNPQAFVTPQYIDDLAWRTPTQYSSNSWIVRTALADAPRNEDPFLNIRNNQPARVDVLIDDSAEPTPSWLQGRGYRNLYGTIDITTGSTARRTMRVWTGFFSPQIIPLGPPAGSSPETMMYIVYLIPCSNSTTVCPPSTFGPRAEDTDPQMP